MTRYILSLLIALAVFNIGKSQNLKADGYKGIWYTLGQVSEYGDKYSGGLGTYTADHIPLAIYAPEVDKTFFAYGGTSSADKRHLLIMLSYYDHKSGVVPKPTIVFDKKGVDDPHDNASLSIDEDGYIWVFVSGRNVSRLGTIMRSSKPYDIEKFDIVHETVMTYPQPWWIEGKGFIHLFTQYTAENTRGRELYWSTSKDGKTWSDNQKLAGMGGHYQISNAVGNKIVTAFNYHPDGGADTRTNVYVAQTEDMGQTWTTVDGKLLNTPLTNPHGETLVYDYEKENKLVYLNDINFDKDGNPIILAIVSHYFRPGPNGDPREWFTYHWKNGKWEINKVCESSHNYDMGSLFVDGKKWTVLGPTEAGPQKYGTGGEMAIWESKNEGRTWKKLRNVTKNSTRNHSYARRPVNAHKDFYAFWADGDADNFSESKLYFTNQKGDKVWQLPYNMNEKFSKLIRVK